MKSIDFSKWKPENVRKFKCLSKVRKGTKLYSTFGNEPELVEVVGIARRLSGNPNITTLVVKFPNGTLQRFNAFGNLVLNRFGVTDPGQECFLFKDKNLTW